MSETFEIENRRLYDSRQAGGHKLRAGETVEIPVEAGALAAQVTVTAVDADGWGFLTLFAGGPVPDTSCLNYEADQTIANTTAGGLNADGSCFVFAHEATHLVVDLVGVYR